MATMELAQRANCPHWVSRCQLSALWSQQTVHLMLKLPFATFPANLETPTPRSAMQGAARDQAVGTEGNKGSQALHLTASASYKELATVQYTEEEQRVLDAAKWEHRDTTAACRRCLQVGSAAADPELAASCMGASSSAPPQHSRWGGGVQVGAGAPPSGY